MKIITGATGTEHVTAADDGSLLATLFGTSQFVLPLGNQLEHEVISATKIRIKSGDLMVHGRYARIPHGTYDEVTIENGATGYNRNDLIVCRYEETDGIESMILKVIKGTPSTGTAVDPTVTTGNILNGDPVHEFPLYRVKLSGINLNAVETLFDVWAANKTHTHTADQLPAITSAMLPTVPVSKGGTGADNKKDSLNNLIKLNPAELNGKQDTPQTWEGMGTGMVGLDESIKVGSYVKNFVNAPCYGLLINFFNGSIKKQVLIADVNSRASIYIREPINVNSNAWCEWITFNDKWDTIDTITKGTWDYLEIQEIGNEKIIKGYATSFQWNGSMGDVFADVGTANAPARNCYAFACCGGKRIARVVIDVNGQLVVDYIVNLADGANYTKDTWLEFRLEYSVADQ